MIDAQCSPDTPATLLNRIYSEGKKYIASFSPLVFAAAEKGDRTAEGILERNFTYVADLIRVAAQAFPPTDTIRVVLAGGVTNQPFCLPRLTAALSDPRLDLQLLPCESYYSVRPVFYDIVLGSKLIRDDTSAQILDIVFDSSFYDPGLLWNFGSITDTLLTSTNVASMLASVSSRVDTAIEKLNEKLGAAN